jgi:hypothetical protein
MRLAAASMPEKLKGGRQALRRARKRSCPRSPVPNGIFTDFDTISPGVKIARK